MEEAAIAGEEVNKCPQQMWFASRANHTELPAIRPYLGVLDPAFYTHSNLKFQAIERLYAASAQFVRGSERSIGDIGRMTRWEGVDKSLEKMVKTANLDCVADRRLIWEAFKEIQLGIDHCLFKAEYEGIKMKESYEVNSRGLEIFTKRWLPENSLVKALVFFCHGLHGYIPSFDNLVNDVVEHFSKIKENSEFKGHRSFLFGQSMGGAVALKIHLKRPQLWDGAILLAPMCKIANDIEYCCSLGINKDYKVKVAMLVQGYKKGAKNHNRSKFYNCYRYDESRKSEDQELEDLKTKISWRPQSPIVPPELLLITFLSSSGGTEEDVTTRGGERSITSSHYLSQAFSSVLKISWFIVSPEYQLQLWIQSRGDAGVLDWVEVANLHHLLHHHIQLQHALPYIRPPYLWCRSSLLVSLSYNIHLSNIFPPPLPYLLFLPLLVSGSLSDGATESSVLDLGRRLLRPVGYDRSWILPLEESANYWISWRILQGVDRQDKCYHGFSLGPISDVAYWWRRISGSYTGCHAQIHFSFFSLIISSRLWPPDLFSFPPGPFSGGSLNAQFGLPPDEEASGSYSPGADNLVGRDVVLAVTTEILPPVRVLLMVRTSDCDSRSNTYVLLLGSSAAGRCADRCVRRVGAPEGWSLLAGFPVFMSFTGTTIVLATTTGKSRLPNWIVAPAFSVSMIAFASWILAPCPSWTVIGVFCSSICTNERMACKQETGQLGNVKHLWIPQLHPLMEGEFITYAWGGV
ncbi:hypothetical protein M5K25_011227 [Dendrobium thyrsiflorum]|uniref:Serine aminopeptidase S33 domain-containing protein n=1 Tax=Dendrobium thyrsiflorum TaxID=117978 RepID=A0ABD0V9I0_DENTH